MLDKGKEVRIAVQMEMVESRIDEDRKKDDAFPFDFLSSDASIRC